MKVSFIATSGTKFIITGQPTDADSRVMTEYVPSTRDLEEYVDWLREEREMLAQGPQLVGSDLPKLLLNGGFLSIVSDETIPMEAIHFLNEMGKRIVLREGGRESGFQPNSRVGSREGLRLAGATVVADATVIQQGEGSQGVPGQLEE